MKTINYLNKNLILFSLCIIIFTYNIRAQEVSVIEQSINPGGVIDELPLPPPALEGTFYLEDEWREGYVVLANGDSIGKILLKYDLQNKLLEIRTHKYIKVCTPNLLKEFYVIEPMAGITNFKNITTFDKSKIGVLEVKYKNGDYIYGTEPYIYIKEPNYVPTVDMGSKNKKIIKKTNYHFGKGTKLTQFRKNKKSVLELTGKHASKVEDFIKSNKLNIKNDNELTMVFDYYIGLIQG